MLHNNPGEETLEKLRNWLMKNIQEPMQSTKICARQSSPKKSSLLCIKVSKFK